MAEDVQGQRHDRTALILYGSETGNSQDAAELLGRITERLHFVTRVREMDCVEIVCHFLSTSRIYPCAYSCVTACPIKIHRGHFRNLNNRTRRAPEECKEILEKSIEEAFASGMS